MNQISSSSDVKSTWTPEKVTALFTAIIALATLASVAATVVIGAVSYMQWQELQTATKVSRSQADAARSANLLASKVLSITMESAKKQARAYLIFGLPELNSVNIAPGADPKKYHYLDFNQHSNPVITVKNIGATPAYQVQRLARGMFVNVNSTIQRFAPSPSELLEAGAKEHQGYILGSKESDTFPGAFQTVTDEINAGFRSKKMVYLIQMYAYYRDVFGDPHYISACHIVDDDSSASKKEGGYVEMVPIAGCGEEID
jgi:hypothetical protein